MNNIPQVKVGIVAVSRDCFPESLSVNRRKALIDAYTKKFGATEIYECPVCIVESEIHMVQALEDVKNAGCNALVVYLGNFGPEISETLLAKHFDGPVMFCAAAEESAEDLMDGRGDAFSTDNTEVLAWALSNPGFTVGIDALGNADTIAPAVQKGNTTLLDWINSEIEALAGENFFHADYEATLAPVYGEAADPDALVVEGGVVE